MATAEQIGMMQLMGCELRTRAIHDGVAYCIWGKTSEGNRWQTMWRPSEHLAWHEAAGFLFYDRSDGLLPIFDHKLDTVY